MGWATTLISPPDGDLGAFRASLRAAAGAGRGGLLSRPRRAGRRPAARSWRISWRTAAAREAEILAALARGPATVGELVAAIYGGVDPALHGAAARNVLAHLIDLAERGLARRRGRRPRGRWRLGRYPVGRGVPKSTRCWALTMWARIRSRAAGPSPAAMAA